MVLSGPAVLKLAGLVTAGRGLAGWGRVALEWLPGRWAVAIPWGLARGISLLADSGSAGPGFAWPWPALAGPQPTVSWLCPKVGAARTSSCVGARLELELLAALPEWSVGGGPASAGLRMAGAAVATPGHAPPRPRTARRPACLIEYAARGLSGLRALRSARTAQRAQRHLRHFLPTGRGGGARRAGRLIGPAVPPWRVPNGHGLHQACIMPASGPPRRGGATRRHVVPRCGWASLG